MIQLEKVDSINKIIIILSNKNNKTIYNKI